MSYELDFKRRRVSCNNVQNQGSSSERPTSNLNHLVRGIAKNHITTTEGERWPSNLLNNLNYQFPTPIQPPKESAHQKILAFRPHNINLQINRYPVASHGLMSSRSALPDLLNSQGFHNSNSAMNVGYNSTSFSSSNPRYFGGSSSKNYSQNVASAPDGMRLISPLGVQLANSEFVPSPEQVSNITSCSYEDMISDTESRALLPTSVRESISGPSAQNFNQQQAFHQGQFRSSGEETLLAFNREFPTSLLGSVGSFGPNLNLQYNPHILPTSSNSHRVTCGHAMNKGMPSQLRRSVLSKQHIHAADQKNHLCNCNGLNCNICGPERRSHGMANFCLESSNQKHDTLEPPSNESRIQTGTLADILPPNYLNSLMTVGDQFPQEFSASPRQQSLCHQLPSLEQWPKASVFNEDILEVKRRRLNESRGQEANSIITKDASQNNKRKVLDIASYEHKSEWPERNTNTTNVEFKKPPEISFRGVHLCFKEKISDGKEESSQGGPKAGEPQQANCDFNSASDVYDSVLESAQSTAPSVSTADCDLVAMESEKTMTPGVSMADCDSGIEPEKTKTPSVPTAGSDSVMESEKTMTPGVSMADCDSGIETEKTKTPSVPTADPDSGIESAQIKKPSDCDSVMSSEQTRRPRASLADSFTASQIKEHLMSFIQNQEIPGNTTPSINQEICQLCSLDKLLLASTAIYCSSCDSQIKQNTGYYWSPDEDGSQPVVCIPCFRRSRGAKILVRGGSVCRANLQKRRNDEEREDTWVQCDKCQGWQHRICGLYNDARKNADYVCPKCCLEEIEDGRRVPLTETAAKDLPRTDLSDHIEQRLSTRMRQEREEMAQVSGTELEKVPGAEGLSVRVVVAVDKHLEVKQQFRDIFHGEDYPEEFTYRSKRLGGVDVCLFGMCVQEFGSDCAGPNHRCVYISYIDSVKYFKPERSTASGESLRTFVYHEILIGYLEYCKKRGFATCYIWSCPPIKGEDYIFYCHPETQKNPKQDKLRQWYKLMLRKASEDGVVVDTINLYNHFFAPTRRGNNKRTAARLPYFDGDYWSAAAQSIIKKLEEDEQVCWGAPSRRTLTALGQENPGVITKESRVMQKLGETIMPMKENFMVVRLQHMCTSCHELILSGSRWFCNQCNKIHLCSRCFGTGKLLSQGRKHTCPSGEKCQLSEDVLSNVAVDTKDEDGVLVNQLFETRDDLLNKCQQYGYQFDTIANAKYSSMMILYHLLMKKPIPQKQTAVMLKAALGALVHADECKSMNCSYPGCLNIRRLLHHASRCSVRVHNGCKSCERAWLILKEHAQICQDSNCRIPRCLDIRKHRAMLASNKTKSQQ